MRAFMAQVTSPIFGALADRGVSRKGLIAAGVVVWSLATAAGAFSTNFATFMLARMGVGVGEAAYATSECLIPTG